MRLTGAIPKQSNSTAQIRPPPWLNLRIKPELDLLPLELDFLYGWDESGLMAIFGSVSGSENQFLGILFAKDTYFSYF